MNGYDIFKILLVSILLSCNKEQVKKVDLEMEKIEIPISRRTIVIGSSIAAGVGATPGGGWVNLLQNEFSTDKFTNFGVPGSTTHHFLPTVFYTSNLANRFPLPDTLKNVDAVVKMNPQIVIVSITSNDVALPLPLDIYMNNIKCITDTLEKNNISFLVTSTILRDDFSLDRKKKLLVLYKRLQELYNDKFVDIFTPNGDTSTLQINPVYYSSDKIHPNNEGHRNIYLNIRTLYEKIR